MLGTQCSWMEYKKVEANLDMNNRLVINLATPHPISNDHAVNVRFFNDQANASNLKLSTQLTEACKAYVDESHLEPSLLRSRF